MSKELSRHEIREKALQALFPLDFNQELTKKDAINHALSIDQQAFVSEDEEEFVPVYLDELVGGVVEHQAELDAIIQKHLRSNWSIQRIAKMDLIILRIGIYEMLYNTQVPNRVVLNEAIELAKTFSDDQSRKFVNGILSNVMKEIDEAEANS
ncbi:transcription antitermination factor NusB [Enterococcus xiangfangensis]|uniref:Transcription antitermination protein NusB n=1 Tax=Enterococcus xiangfangensis TaxID=1296537 RepID=A0ABU3F6V2_9ENTE|nr:transcription antitermination factor NusB [Enterococcus xiangfangensis]MDT2758394.1 transcription antitermination factor NusB [Enterococcus xiangfangensis]